MKNKIVKKCLYNSEILKDNIKLLKNKYNFLEEFIIGKSVLDEDIKCLKLGKGKKKVFINASHHANEWITSLLIMMYVENYLNMFYSNVENYKGYNIKKLWNNTTLYIVPMVNPDGVNLVLNVDKVINNKKYKYLWKKNVYKLNMWKSNIRGVDLNLNYPYGFNEAKLIKAKKGIMKEGERDFCGINPLSEPETVALYKLTKLYKFDITISLHSQGKEIYWEGGKNKKEEAYNLGKIFEKISGYKLKKPDYNYSFAGYKDWSVEELKNIGFTIEVGKGREKVSLDIEKVYEIYEEIEEIFLKVLE